MVRLRKRATARTVLVVLIDPPAPSYIGRGHRSTVGVRLTGRQVGLTISDRESSCPGRNCRRAVAGFARAAFTIAPYLQNRSGDSVVVRWQVASPDSGRVEYGLTAGYGSSESDSAARSTTN